MLTIFLDALDEYQGFPEVISKWILDLIEASRNPRSRTNMRFCFSSRHWDSFVKAFDREPGFALHEQTRQDIKLYVVSRLSQLASYDSSTLESRLTFSRHLSPARIIDLIVFSAEGVFLWVKLALDELAYVHPSVLHENFEILIDKLPADLEEFYVRTISWILRHSRFRAYAILEIVARSSLLVNLKDLYYASAVAIGTTYQECTSLLASAEAQLRPSSKSEDEVGEGLLNLCGGLLECVKSPGIRRIVVQFIHRTVRDFVASTRFPQIMFGETYKLQLDNGFTFLMKYRFIAWGVYQLGQFR